MRWSWLFLSLLLGITGCAHSSVPALPASHGHLMSVMEGVQSKRGLPATGLWDLVVGDEVAPSPPPRLDPAQAPVVFEEAVKTLRGTPGEDAVLSALRDVSAACAAELAEACAFWSGAFTAPEPSSPAAFRYPEALLQKGAFAFMVFQGRIGTDGRVRDCTVVEGARLPGIEENLAALQAARYRPATFSGHPVSIQYTFNVRFVPNGITLNRHQELDWARLRARQNPGSRSAWLNLAMKLAKEAPEDPLYPQAITRAFFLAPTNGWAATEAAWQFVQSGQYAPALGAVRPFLRRSHNPYVLETAAAAQFGLKQCTAALAEQRKAVELLPAEWPAPERERFQRKLQDYESACAVPKDVSAATGPR
ncbi:energy transducer TonB [Corallococcus interemptor]|uniref:energy transducer TonB n=1 Tax=Corallococcus interemptor TaxID=2316720 RepID=UPI003CFC4909